MTDPVDAAAKAIYDDCQSNIEPKWAWEELAEWHRESFRRPIRAVLPILRRMHFQEAAELIEAQTVVDATRDSESRRIFFWEAASFLRGLAGDSEKR